MAEKVVPIRRQDEILKELIRLRLDKYTGSVTLHFNGGKILTYEKREIVRLQG